MTISISLILHPDSDKELMKEVFTKLDKWHPLSLRKYDSKEEANQTLNRIYNPNHSVSFKVDKMYLVQTHLPVLPDLVIAWGPEETLPETFSDFIHFAIYSTVDEDYFMEVIELLKVPVLQPENPQVAKEYELKKHFDNMRDWMFYEVQRPFNEAPFTTIIKSYSKQGIEPFFGQLFVSKSWGILKSDLEFLEALWKFEFNDRPFDMTDILKKHADDLKPSAGKLPKEYPDVFRKSIKELINIVDFY